MGNREFGEPRTRDLAQKLRWLLLPGLLALAILMQLPGCIGGLADTPSKRYFAAVSSYETLQGVAAAYVVSPTADPDAVLVIAEIDERSVRVLKDGARIARTNPLPGTPEAHQLLIIQQTVVSIASELRDVLIDHRVAIPGGQLIMFAAVPVAIQLLDVIILLAQQAPLVVLKYQQLKARLEAVPEGEEIPAEVWDDILAAVDANSDVIQVAAANIRAARGLTPEVLAEIPAV